MKEVPITTHVTSVRLVSPCKLKILPMENCKFLFYSMPDPAISRSLIRLRFLGMIYTDIDDFLYLCSAFVDILIDNFPLRRKVEIITHGVQ